MRASINRETAECRKLLVDVDDELNTGEDYMSVGHWLYDSQESFHGEKVCINGVDSFVFKDSRVPEFSLPLQYVEVEE